MPETLGENRAGAASRFPRPTLHGQQMIVDAMLCQQPLTLAGVLGEHGSLGLEFGPYIHVKVRYYRSILTVHPADRIHEVEMWDRG